MKKLLPILLLLLAVGSAEAQSQSATYYPGTNSDNFRIYYLKKTLSLAEVSALGTTPITLVPAQPGFALFPVICTVRRTGNPFLSSGNLQIRSVTAAPFAWLTMSSTVLTRNTGTGGLSSGLAPFNAVGGAIDDATDGIGSKAIDVKAASAVSTDGTHLGSSIVIDLWYLVLPIFP